MTAVAYSALRDHQLAEDAAQEAFARALVNLRKLKTPEKFAPWLAQICRHVAIDMGRARRQGTDIEGLPPVQDEPERDSSVEIVRRAIGDLPEPMREVLILRYYDDRSYEQIQNAQTITWKITFYNHVTSKDGQRTWVESETREMAYKAPGLYREVYHPTSRGGVEHICITDSVNLKSLTLVPQEQRATLRKLALATFNSRGPFAVALEHMNKPDLEWVGKRTTPKGEVNVFRWAFQRPSHNKEWSYDFWIDAKTKRLVAVQIPGADIYDPETDPARLNPSEKEWSMGKPACSRQHDINFDAELDDSLFRLDPPVGYSTETKQRAQVTEAQMIEYLGAMAGYHGQTFPDQPYSVGSERLNEIYDKAEADRTPAERRLLNIVDHCKMASLNMMPTGHFIEDHTVAGTFRYLGKGVKLGDTDRIVCWYKLKDTGTYRAVYGDLSVRDVAPQDLPLPVEP